MKILALLTDGVSGYGGIAQYNRDLMGALAALERVDSVVILPRHDDERLRRARDGKLRSLPAIAGRLRYSLSALRAAWRECPDVIFCGHLFMAPLAWLLSRLLRRPWWLQLHGIEAWDRPGVSPVTEGDAFPAWFPMRGIVDAAALVTSVSRFTRRRFLGWADIDPERVRILPNTCDVGIVEHIPKEEARRRRGLTGRKVLLTVSRIDRGDRYKGHDKVLRVLPELLESHPDLVYVIVGDGDNRPMLEATVQEAGMHDAVRFAGRVDAQQLDEYYASADAFVMPSTKEGFGIVFLEAAARSVPIVAGNEDGSVDACAEGKLGRCISPDNDVELVSAVSDALRGGMEPMPPSVNRFERARFDAHVKRLLAHVLCESGVVLQ